MQQWQDVAVLLSLMFIVYWCFVD